jgi:hypothetical protein
MIFKIISFFFKGYLVIDFTGKPIDEAGFWAGLLPRFVVLWRQNISLLFLNSFPPNNKPCSAAYAGMFLGGIPWGK